MGYIPNPELVKEEKFNVVGSFTGMDKHPGSLEGMHE